MSPPPISVRLRRRDRAELQRLTRRGVQPVRVVLRAMALLQLDRGASAPQIAATMALSEQAIRNIGKRYTAGGLPRALYDRPRPGAAERLTPSDKQRIIAMVCSTPPEGLARWTVRLVTDEAVKRKVVARVGRETIRVLLQSHDLKPWREKNVVYRGTHAGVHRVHGGRARAL